MKLFILMMGSLILLQCAAFDKVSTLLDKIAATDSNSKNDNANNSIDKPQPQPQPQESEDENQKKREKAKLIRANEKDSQEYMRQLLKLVRFMNFEADNSSREGIGMYKNRKHGSVFLLNLEKEEHNSYMFTEVKTEERLRYVARLSKATKDNREIMKRKIMPLDESADISKFDFSDRGSMEEFLNTWHIGTLNKEWVSFSYILENQVKYFVMIEVKVLKEAHLKNINQGVMPPRVRILRAEETRTLASLSELKWANTVEARRMPNRFSLDVNHEDPAIHIRPGDIGRIRALINITIETKIEITRRGSAPRYVTFKIKMPIRQETIDLVMFINYNPRIKMYSNLFGYDPRHDQIYIVVGNNRQMNYRRLNTIVDDNGFLPAGYLARRR